MLSPVLKGTCFRSTAVTAQPSPPPSRALLTARSTHTPKRGAAGARSCGGAELGTAEFPAREHQRVQGLTKPPVQIVEYVSSARKASVSYVISWASGGLYFLFLKAIRTYCGKLENVKKIKVKPRVHPPAPANQWRAVWGQHSSKVLASLQLNGRTKESVSRCAPRGTWPVCLDKHPDVF